MLQRIGTTILLLTFVTSGAGDLAGLEPEGQEANLRNALLPKSETQALEFLAEFPEFDGRGVTVAIFDTGVDPGAPLLSSTTDGQPKFVDLIDATGDGDVTTTVKQKSENGRLVGLTGRELTIGETWSNPTGEYRLGMKAAWDFFPPELVERMKSEWKDKWEENQRERLHQLERQLSDDKSDISKKERQSRVDLLRSLLNDNADPGPIYDCVVFHDGTVWRAVVDTDEDGDLAEESVLTDFDVEPKFSTFGDNSSLNFSVHIYNDGDLLSLVTVSGEHGTHVAGIVAAHDPDHPERNGVAPGARLVSVKIGDNRLDGMETGTALVRAVPAVIKHKCDLINMSYGEPGAPANFGRVVDHFSRLVREENIIFVSSAGNAGPALSTVGAPGGTSTALIGVGAYVSPAMMQAEYTVREERPGVAYTWSSRGPTYDGAAGVDIFAPGGAIAPVPNYSLQPARQMNGTSMASPNACGNIALILSGMKANKKPYNFVSVLRALQTTAVSVETTDRFVQGPGLVQTLDAYNHLMSDNSNDDDLVEIEVNIEGKRGIYLRDSYESMHVADRTVLLKPAFTSATTNERKLAYEVPLRFESTADWVDVGPLMVLPHDGRPMSVQVDPTELDPGVHFAEILGFDDRNADRGPLVRIPVTVVRSVSAKNNSVSWSAKTNSGEVIRKFVNVPSDAVSATLKVRRIGGDNVRMGFVHLVQLVPGQTFEKGENSWVVRLDGDEVVEHDFAVVPGRALEVCWGHYWSSLGEGEFEFDLTFQRLNVSSNKLALSPGLPGQRFDVTALSNPLHVDINGSLKTHRKLLVPASAKVEAMTDDRDQLPEAEQTHRLTLDYKLTRASAGSVTLSCPQLDQLLYESPLDGMFISVIDERGVERATQDMFAEEPTRIPAGANTIRVELKHTDENVLNRWKQMLIAVDQPISSVSIPVSHSNAQLAGGSSRAGMVEIQPGETVSVWIGCPKLPGGDVQPGDVLIGSLSVSDDVKGLSIPVTAVAPPQGGSSSDKTNSPKSLSRDLSAADALVEFQFERLAALKYPDDKEQINELAETLKSTGHKRRLAVTLLHLIDTDAHRKEHLAEVVSAAERVLKSIPRAKVQAYFGIRQQPETAGEKKLHSQRTEEKRDLIDALYRKGRALAYMELPDVVEKHPIENQEKLSEQIETTFKQLSRWVDPEAPDYVLLKVRVLRRQGNIAQAIQLLKKVHDKPAQESWLHHKKLRDMYTELGWSDWSKREQSWMLRYDPGHAKQ